MSQTPESLERLQAAHKAFIRAQEIKQAQISMVKDVCAPFNGSDLLRNLISQAPKDVLTQYGIYSPDGREEITVEGLTVLEGDGYKEALIISQFGVGSVVWGREDAGNTRVVLTNTGFIEGQPKLFDFGHILHGQTADSLLSLLNDAVDRLNQSIYNNPQSI